MQHDWVQLHSDPIDIAPVLQFVTDPQAGGIAFFLGTTRAEIQADEVGLAILGPLRELDEVAYLRFASVYQSFESLDDFEAAITLLRAEHEPTGVEPEHH